MVPVAKKTLFDKKMGIDKSITNLKGIKWFKMRRQQPTTQTVEW